MIDSPLDDDDDVDGEESIESLPFFLLSPPLSPCALLLPKARPSLSARRLLMRSR